MDESRRAAAVERALAPSLHERILRDGFPTVPGLEEVYAEFGGLTVGERGEGQDSARTPVEFDPLLCIGEADRFARLQREVPGLAIAPRGWVLGAPLVGRRSSAHGARPPGAGGGAGAGAG